MEFKGEKVMRFYEDYDYYYFSKDQTTSAEERSIIAQKELSYAKDFMKTSFAPEDTPAGNIKKYFPIAVFLIGVILAIVFSLMKMVTACVCTFGGIFTFFGILMMIPADPSNGNDELEKRPGQSKLPKGLVGLICIGFGLAIIIPTLMAPSIGGGKAALITGGLWFTLGGILFIADTIVRAVRSRIAYTEDVNGTCIGYVKMIEGSDSGNGTGRRYVVGAPVFEYYYNGTTYQAFQDNDMRTGTLTPSLGSPAEIKVNPNDPCDIKYHNNIGGRIFAMIMAIICLGVGVFILTNISNFDTSNFKVTTLGGEVGGKAQVTDEMIAEYVTGDFTITYVTVEKKYQEEDVWLVDLSNGETKRLSDDDVEKYEEGTAFYLVTPVDGSSGINFMADEWEYAGSHTVQGMP